MLGLGVWGESQCLISVLGLPILIAYALKDLSSIPYADLNVLIFAVLICICS